MREFMLEREIEFGLATLKAIALRKGDDAVDDPERHRPGGIGRDDETNAADPRQFRRGGKDRAAITKIAPMMIDEGDDRAGHPKQTDEKHPVDGPDARGVGGEPELRIAHAQTGGRHRDLGKRRGSNLGRRG